MTADPGILVLGCPRSGTTLLRRLLDAHPRIACPPETVVFARIGRLLQEDPLAEGLTFGMRTGLAFAGVDPEETLDRVRELAFGLHRAIAERKNKARWASKTAMDAFYVDEIEALCGDRVQYVAVVRHGLDVACSLRELCVQNDALLPEIHAYVRRFPFLLEALAHLWADRTTRIDRLVADHPRTAFLLRYEDLVAKPHAVLAELFTFLGEAPDPSVIERALATADFGLGDPGTWGRARLDAASVGRWRTELTPHTAARLGTIVNPVLAAHGYDTLPPPVALGPDEARLSHEVGLAARRMGRR